MFALSGLIIRSGLCVGLRLSFLLKSQEICIIEILFQRLAFITVGNFSEQDDLGCAVRDHMVHINIKVPPAFRLEDPESKKRAADQLIVSDQVLAKIHKPGFCYFFDNDPLVRVRLIFLYDFPLPVKHQQRRERAVGLQDILNRSRETRQIHIIAQPEQKGVIVHVGMRRAKLPVENCQLFLAQRMFFPS